MRDCQQSCWCCTGILLCNMCVFVCACTVAASLCQDCSLHLSLPAEYCCQVLSWQPGMPASAAKQSHVLWCAFSATLWLESTRLSETQSNSDRSCWDLWFAKNAFSPEAALPRCAFSACQQFRAHYVVCRCYTRTCRPAVLEKRPGCS